MFPLRGVGDAPLRTLTPDDAQGIAALYPASPPQPAPAPMAVKPAAGDGRVSITLTGTGFADGAALRFFLDGTPPLEAHVASSQPAQLVAEADLGATPPGCYDLVVQNPTGKEGALFSAFAVGGAKCQTVDPGAKGCACDASGGGVGAALAAAAAMILALRRRSVG